MQLCAITGGIGSGKSTVAWMLQQRGAYRIDADKIAKLTQAPGAEAYERIVEHWGVTILTIKGEIDRKKLAQRVFENPSELEKLESYVHPAVRQRISREITNQQNQKRVVLLELPLLAKGDQYLEEVAGVIVVDSPISETMKRLQKFRGLTKQQADARIKNQIDPEQRQAFADFVIHNSGTLEEVKNQIEPCWEWLQTLPTYKPRSKT